MFVLLRRRVTPSDLLSSKLYSQDDFYRAFLKDLGRCGHEVIIESPFITRRRLETMLPALQKLKGRRVKVVQPAEHDAPYDVCAEAIIRALQAIGIIVLFTGGHHRKIAVLDRRVLYEGSLNILSQNDSSEIMRRIDSPFLAQQMLHFNKLDKFLR